MTSPLPPHRHAPGRTRTFNLGLKRTLLYQLSYGRKAGPQTTRASPRSAPGGTRTPDPQLRRLLLYPTELLAQIECNVIHPTIVRNGSASPLCSVVSVRGVHWFLSLLPCPDRVSGLERAMHGRLVRPLVMFTPFGRTSSRRDTPDPSAVRASFRSRTSAAVNGNRDLSLAATSLSATSLHQCTNVCKRVG